MNKKAKSGRKEVRSFFVIKRGMEKKCFFDKNLSKVCDNLLTILKKDVIVYKA